MLPAPVCEILGQIFGWLALSPWGGVFEWVLRILDGLCGTGEPAA